MYRAVCLMALLFGAGCSGSSATPSDLGVDPDLATGSAGDDGGSGGDGGGGGTDLSISRADLGYGGPAGLVLLAGSPGGYGNADGIGADARFSAVNGSAPDGAGNLYLADLNGVRKLVMATGAVTTVATGLSYPQDVVWDGAGSLYVSVSAPVAAGDRVVKIAVANGAVTNLAGSTTSRGSADGTGSAALFKGASGLALDGAGNLYVADSENHTIRKIVVATGAVTTIAGTAGSSGGTDGTGAAARFNQPSGLAWDGAGNLYISETAGYTIRKLVVATGAVSTVAGSSGVQGYQDGTGPAARFHTPARLTLDGAGSLYVSDGPASTLRKIVLATGQVSTFAGSYGTPGPADGVGLAARFTIVHSVRWAGNGSLYAGDGNTLRKIDTATAQVTTVAGLPLHFGRVDGIGSAARFGGPHGMTADGSGNVYVAEGPAIRRVNALSGAVTTIAGSITMSGSTDGIGTAARFYGSNGVAWDGAGSLYVADSSNHTIRRISLATNQVTTIAGTPGMGGFSDGTGAAALFKSPSGIAADPTGLVWVADVGNSRLRQINAATGVVTTIGTQGTSQDGVGAAARFVSVQDVTTDLSGTVFIADASSIRKMVAATSAVTTLAGGSFATDIADGTGAAARFVRPLSLAYDPQGALFVTDRSATAGWIRKVNVATQQVTTVVGRRATGVLLGALPGGLNQPYGVAAIPGFGLAIGDEAEQVLLIAHGL